MKPLERELMLAIAALLLRQAEKNVPDEELKRLKKAMKAMVP